MSVINEVVNMPVIRPLATYDKIDIIKLSKKMNCYDISIKPFEDCCTVYVPKKPTTAPKLDRCIYYESKYDFDALVDKTVENTKTIMIHSNDDLDLTMLGLVVSEVL